MARNDTSNCCDSENRVDCLTEAGNWGRCKDFGELLSVTLNSFLVKFMKYASFTVCGDPAILSEDTFSNFYLSRALDDTCTGGKWLASHLSANVGFTLDLKCPKVPKKVKMMNAQDPNHW